MLSGPLGLGGAGIPLGGVSGGLFLLRGPGRGEGSDKAFAWTKRAAEHGGWNAQCNLAEFYEEGIGTQAGLDRAKHWYQQAAAQGHTLALDKCRALSISVP